MDRLAKRYDVGIVSTNLSNWIFGNNFLSIPLEFYYGLAIFLAVWYVLSFTPVGQKSLVIGQSREVARLTGVRVNRMRAWAFILGAAIAGIAGVAYAATNGTVDPTAGSALILPALTSGNATGTPAKYIATCPDITSPIACGPPLYVTCTILSPVM